MEGLKLNINFDVVKKEMVENAYHFANLIFDNIGELNKQGVKSKDIKITVSPKGEELLVMLLRDCVTRETQHLPCDYKLNGYTVEVAPEQIEDFLVIGNIIERKG